MEVGRLSSLSLRDVALLEVSHIMREGSEVFRSSDTASSLLGYFRETNIYEAPVVGENKIGFVTLRDLLNVSHPERTRLGKVWKFVGVLRPDNRISEAVELMIQNDTRAVPIDGDSSAVGILSQVEVAQALSDARELKEIPIKDVMMHPVITIEKGSKISSARRLMLDRRISHLPVLNKDRFLGVVTARRIVYHFIAPLSGTVTGEFIGEAVRRLDGAVEGVMDLHPFTAEPQTSCMKVARGFVKEEKSACIVTGVGGEVLGILTPKELVSLLRRLWIEEEKVPISIVGLTEKEGFFEASVAEEKLRRVIERNMRFYPEIEEVTVRLRRRDVGGYRTRYMLTARIHGPYKQLYAEAEDWELMMAFDDLCDELDRSMKKTKQERIERPSRRKIGKPTQRKIGVP